MSKSDYSAGKVASPLLTTKKSLSRTASPSLSRPVNTFLPEELSRYEITPDERKAIQQLKERLGDQITPRYTDVRLCRFLRARGRKVDQAEEMIRKEMKWRSDTKIEEKCEQIKLNKNFEKMMSYWPGGFHGVDRFGVPMIVERLASIDSTSTFTSATHDFMIDFHIYMMEQNDKVISQAFETLGAPVGICFIDDLTGLSMKHYSGKVMDTLKEMSQIDDKYYPESIRKFVLINCPGAFKFFWKIAKVMLDKNTVAKFAVCKGDYKEEIGKIATPENLPQFLGGTCTACRHTSTQCKFGGGPAPKWDK